LSGGSEVAPPIPPPAPYAGHQPGALRYEDPQTAIFRDAEAPSHPGWPEDDSIDSAVIQGYIIGQDEGNDSI
jgi:hypothetical protein